MAFLFVVGVYGLVGLGLLWLIERYRVMEWRLFAWPPWSRDAAGERGDWDQRERVGAFEGRAMNVELAESGRGALAHGTVDPARDDREQLAPYGGCPGDMEATSST